MLGGALRSTVGEAISTGIETAWLSLDWKAIKDTFSSYIFHTFWESLQKQDMMSPKNSGPKAWR